MSVIVCAPSGSFAAVPVSAENTAASPVAQAWGETPAVAEELQLVLLVFHVPLEVAPAPLAPPWSFNRGSWPRWRAATVEEKHRRIEPAERADQS